MVTMAVAEQTFHTPPSAMLSDDEAALVAAICNRVARMIGLSDRQGLQEDFAIVQTHYPLDLDSLLESADDVLVQELLRVIDHTDRASSTLHSGYSSRFRREMRRLAG